LPSIGTLQVYEAPAGPNIRVDSGVVEGSQVTVHYDPMLAKLITWGKSRQDSLARMRWALRHYPVLGVTTNIEFLQALLDHPEFITGEVNTQFLDEIAIELPVDDGESKYALFAAAWALSQTRNGGGLNDRNDGKNADHHGPWQARSAWRLG
jgi:acetyl/propionyl-CoA carboxylase alpha subunit